MQHVQLAKFFHQCRYFLVKIFGTIPWLIAYLVPILATFLMDGPIPSYLQLATNHYSKRVQQQMVILLVDGHSSHIIIDVEVTKVCLDNQIPAYNHTPHNLLLQQAAWEKECINY